MESIFEVLYDWNSVLVFIIGLIIDVVFFFISLKHNNNKISRLSIIIIIIILFVSLGLFCLINYVQNEYTKVPKIDSKKPLAQTLNILDDAKLSYSIFEEDGYIQYDEAAREKINAGADLASSNFSVIGIKPQEGEFVTQSTFVTLTITWKETLSNFAIDKKEDVDSVVDNLYESINPDFIYPFNAKEFTLSVEKAVMKITADHMDEIYMGIYPEDNTPVAVSLINFNTGETVQTRTTSMGQQVVFSDLPNGTYYYIVTCEGYKSYIPTNPFRLKYDSTKEIDILPWGVNLEETSIVYNSPFKVQLVDSSGNPLVGYKTYIRGADPTIQNMYSYSSYPMTTDENGYLTMWENLNGIDYYSVSEFHLIEGYVLQIENREREFITVKSSNSDVCTVVY